MSTITDFVPFVEARVAVDTPTPNIHHAIREALTIFLRESTAAVGTIYLTQECTERELLLEVPQCHRLVAVDDIHEQPAGCAPAALWDPWWPKIDRNDPVSPMGSTGDWVHDMADGGRTTIWLTATGRKRRLAVRYCWTLRRAGLLGCDVPEWVLEDHAEAIAAGALELLHRNPADTEASGTFGNLQDSLFRFAVNNARRRKLTQYGPGAFRTGVTHFYGG